VSVVEKVRNVYATHNLVIMEDSQRKLSFFSSNDIASLHPGLLRSSHSNVAGYAIYSAPSHKQNFYVEFIFSETTLAINFHNITIDKSRENRALKADDPIECVAKLKSFLKSRIVKIQSSQQYVSSCITL
jgi:hypothetical protein